MIETKNAENLANGWLLPIWNRVERPHTPVDQVYLTTIYPLMSKGPHLHMKRRGLFCCIRGDVRIVLKIGHNYEVFHSGESYDHRLIEVPPGIPNMIINDSTLEAFVLNMPSPAWTPEEPDDWPVKDWHFEG